MALVRSPAEAEGARLRLAATVPTTFELLVPTTSGSSGEDEMAEVSDPRAGQATAGTGGDNIASSGSTAPRTNDSAGAPASDVPAPPT